MKDAGGWAAGLPTNLRQRSPHGSVEPEGRQQLRLGERQFEAYGSVLELLPEGGAVANRLGVEFALDAVVIVGQQFAASFTREPDTVFVGLKVPRLENAMRKES